MNDSKVRLRSHGIVLFDSDRDSGGNRNPPRPTDRPPSNRRRKHLRLRLRPSLRINNPAAARKPRRKRRRRFARPSRKDYKNWAYNVGGGASLTNGNTAHYVRGGGGIAAPEWPATPTSILDCASTSSSTIFPCARPRCRPRRRPGATDHVYSLTLGPIINIPVTEGLGRIHRWRSRLFTIAPGNSIPRLRSGISLQWLLPVVGTLLRRKLADQRQLPALQPERIRRGFRRRHHPQDSPEYGFLRRVPLLSTASTTASPPTCVRSPSAFAGSSDLWNLLFGIRAVVHRSAVLLFCNCAKDEPCCGCLATARAGVGPGLTAQLDEVVRAGPASMLDRWPPRLRRAGRPGSGSRRNLPCGDRNCGRARASTLLREIAGRQTIPARSSPAISRAHSQTTSRATLPPHGTAEPCRMD